MEEALYLSNIASHVTMIHRREKFRGEKILADRIMAVSRAVIFRSSWDSALEEVLGDKKG